MFNSLSAPIITANSLHLPLVIAFLLRILAPVHRRGHKDANPVCCGGRPAVSSGSQTGLIMHWIAPTEKKHRRHRFTGRSLREATDAPKCQDYLLRLTFTLHLD